MKPYTMYCTLTRPFFKNFDLDLCIDVFYNNAKESQSCSERHKFKNKNFNFEELN